MMPENHFRSQMPPQPPQQQMPGQFGQQSQMPQPPSSFPHQPQQLLPGGPPTQHSLPMQNQPPYGMPGMLSQQPMHPSGPGGPMHLSGGPIPGGPGLGIPSGPSQGIGGPTGGPGPAGAIAGAGNVVQSADNSYHPITRAKILMVDLKQALQVLMKAATDGTKEQALNDNAPAGGDTPVATTAMDAEEIRRALELFDSICDQIEANFMMIQDLYREQISSDRYTPANVLLGSQKTDEPPQLPPDALPGRPLLTYKDYEELTRIQAQFANTVRESFAECSRLLQ